MTEDEPGGDPAQGPQAGAASSEMRERLEPFVSEKILQSPVSDDEEGGALCTPRCEATGGADEVEISPTDVTENVVDQTKASGKPMSDDVEENLDSLLFLKHDEGWVWESPDAAPAPSPPTLPPPGTIKPIIPYPSSVVFGGSGASAADIQDFHTRMCNPIASPPGSPAVHPDAQVRDERLKVMALKLHDEVHFSRGRNGGRRGSHSHTHPICAQFRTYCTYEEVFEILRDNQIQAAGDDAAVEFAASEALVKWCVLRCVSARIVHLSRASANPAAWCERWRMPPPSLGHRGKPELTKASTLRCEVCLEIESCGLAGLRASVDHSDTVV